MTYFPHGDPDGPDDGYPGSIFATGHAWEHQISEITIPAPVISETKDVDMATILRGTLPYVILELIGLLILILFPQISLWLPSLMH